MSFTINFHKLDFIIIVSGVMSRNNNNKIKFMKINSEIHPSGEEKDTTAFQKPPLQIKDRAKKGRMIITHDKKYRESGQKEGFS